MSPAAGRFGASPRMRSAWVVVLTLVTCASLARPVRADPFHRQTLPLGQRAVGMGGAFTAVADDPSATYYNPAGLVLTNDSSLSASLTLQAFDKSSLERGYRTSEGAATLKHSSEPSLPVFVSAIKLLGKRGEDGRRKHAVGLSSFTIAQRRIAFDVESRGPAASGSSLETLSVGTSEKTQLWGLSYAYRLTPQLSLGFSGFLSLSRTSYSEERISAALGALTNNDGSYDSDSNAYASHLVKTSVKTMLGRIGALYAVNDRLQIGLMVQPPSFHVRGEASVRHRSLVSNTMVSPGQSSVFNAHQKHLTSRNPFPWEVRLGARYELYDWLTLAIDGSMYGRNGTRKNPVVAVGPRKPDEETGAVPEVGAFTNESWYRHYGGNVSIGASASLPRTVTVRMGLYTDLSSAPQVPRYSSVYYAPDVHRVGGTLSVGLRNEGFDLSIGTIGVFGRGNAVAFNADPDVDSRYQRTKMNDRMFLFFLNGVKSAISTLAKKAEKTLMDFKNSRSKADEPEAKLEPEAKQDAQTDDAKTEAEEASQGASPDENTTDAETERETKRVAGDESKRERDEDETKERKKPAPQLAPSP